VTPEQPPPPAGPAEPVEGTASRRRLIFVRLLTVVAILLIVISVIANFVKREALDSSRFRGTSRALIADDTIRNQLAQTLVDQLYANVDVAAALRQRLPPNLQALSGPIAGAVRDAADRSARRLLEGPRVQGAFVNAASAAQRQFVAVLDGNTRRLQTTGGNVVLDVRPLVLDLGNRFSFVPDLSQRIPEGKARVTILKSDQLKTAQNATKALRFIADWIWVLALAAAAAAVWLARGRRRNEVRALAIGILIAGILILIVRTLVGRYLVDHLVKSDSVRPAVANAYAILTDLLRGAGWTAVIIAVIAFAGLWLSGSKPRAVATRRALSPYLRRPEVAYGALVLGYLLLLWWRPTPQFGFWLNVTVYFALAVLGLEVLRRQTAREFPDTEPGGLLDALRDIVGWRPGRAAPADPADELERLARLRAEGALDDAEFAAAKAQVLGARPAV
jgi:Short C-terminal domain